ncbi:protein SpAN-like [Anneissia japonica]|uniref:protein SpAN-like n=1 Tax=Anneissia japonica TaxID=1529436 RepID=UPI001425A5A5|nr:protein SpAN-like [Anneissia japonica]
MRILCIIGLLFITIISFNCEFGNAERTVDSNSTIRRVVSEIMQKMSTGGKFDVKHVKGRIPKGTKRTVLKQVENRKVLAGLWEHPVPGAYQGDMFLTADQESKLLKLKETHGGIHKRKAVTNFAKLWPIATVPFTIDEQLESKTDVIMAAMEYMESISCLHFVPHNTLVSETLGHNSFVHIFKGDGCWSSVGKLSGGKQLISLGIGCYSHGVILHELLHTIGFHHEQSRLDRDDYVQINWINIDESLANNFQKSNVITDYPYDYYSLLHYGRNSFRTDKSSPSIKTVNPLLQFDIGGGNNMTYTDIYILNDLYSCSAECPETDCGSGFLGARCECFCFESDENELDCNQPPVELLKGRLLLQTTDEIANCQPEETSYKTGLFFLQRTVLTMNGDEMYKEIIRLKYETPPQIIMFTIIDKK